LSNVVGVVIYGTDSSGETDEVNAWDTDALTIYLPKTVDTDTLEDATDESFICEYWDDKYIIWKTDDCALASHNDTHFVCECTHTTEFSVQLDTSTVTATSDPLAA